MKVTEIAANQGATSVVLPINEVICGDCTEVMQEWPENSVDCIVTDPPYGISFMSKSWDKALPPVEAFEQMFRVLKPGALAFVMSSPRQDVLWRMLAMLEDVGFQLKQSHISWITKTGFPKAYDVVSNINKRINNDISKAIDNSCKCAVKKSENASIVEKLYLKNLIEAGILTTKNDSVVKDVSDYLSQRRLNVNVNIAERKLSEAPLMLGEENTFIVVENADTWQEPSNSHVKIVGRSLEDQDQILDANIIFVQFDAQTFFTQKITENMTKVEKAQKIENGVEKSWNEMAINALIVGVVEDLKHIILNQLKTFQNLDTKSQTELLSVTNVIITESIKECLTSNMENILGKRLKEKTKKWQGYKSQSGLKPAVEMILMVNKPRSEPTIVENVLRWGTGAMNVDACRIPFKQDDNIHAKNPHTVRKPENYEFRTRNFLEGAIPEESKYDIPKGRFPSNLLVSDNAIDSGEVTRSRGHTPRRGDTGGLYRGGFGVIDREEQHFEDVGGASRYFDLDAWSEHQGFLDVAKPSKAERDFGLTTQPLRVPRSKFNLNDGSKDMKFDGVIPTPRRNTHPTCKPVKLMAYLIELGCPPKGLVVDPFLGSGTTCIAAKRLRRKWIGIEINPEYVEVAEARINIRGPLDNFMEAEK